MNLMKRLALFIALGSLLLAFAQTGSPPETHENNGFVIVNERVTIQVPQGFRNSLSPNH